MDIKEIVGLIVIVASVCNLGDTSKKVSRLRRDNTHSKNEFKILKTMNEKPIENDVSMFKPFIDALVEAYNGGELNIGEFYTEDVTVMIEGRPTSRGLIALVPLMMEQKEVAPQIKNVEIYESKKTSFDDAQVIFKGEFYTANGMFAGYFRCLLILERDKIDDKWRIHTQMMNSYEPMKVEETEEEMLLLQDISK